MTSKERVLKTINHQEPDRVPVGEWGIDHDHVTKIIGKHTYWRNRKDTTLALWDNRRDEVVESLKEDYVRLVEALDYDIVTVELVPPKNHYVKKKPKEIAPGVWEAADGRIYKYAASNDSIQCVTKREGKDELTKEEIDAAISKWGEIDESRFELIDFCCEKFGKEKAILCRDVNIYTPLFDAFEGDFDSDLMRTILIPDEIEKLRPACYAYNQKLIDHCKKKGVTVMMQGQDFGMGTGCLYSPSSIREIFMPVMKKVNDDIKKAGMIPFYHCCGRIWDIMDDFVKVGYQGYQSIQESAGMDNRIVKEKYGKALTLWTGVQCETLIEGSRENVEEEVRRNLEILMPGGGYIFGSTNSVQYGAKTENYLRALEIVREEGKY
jgi:uroporphyrinogen decarboxylase